MADMGFLPAVRRLLDATAPQRQVMLFSATLGPEIETLVTALPNRPRPPRRGGRGARHTRRLPPVLERSPPRAGPGHRLPRRRARPGARLLPDPSWRRPRDRHSSTPVGCGPWPSTAARPRRTVSGPWPPSARAGPGPSSPPTWPPGASTSRTCPASCTSTRPPITPITCIAPAGPGGRGRRAWWCRWWPTSNEPPTGSCSALWASTPSSIRARAQRHSPPRRIRPARRVERPGPRGAPSAVAAERHRSPRGAPEARAAKPHGARVRATRPAAAASDRSRPTPSPVGTVRFFDAKKGYGFLSRPDGAGDVFVHVSGIRGQGPAVLVPGQRVRFDMTTGRRGDMASNVTVI